MTTALPLILCSLWIVAANAAALLPGAGRRWASAALIAAGVPLVGYVTMHHGPIAGFLALGAGAAILRWPVRLPARLPARRGPQADGEADAPQPHPAE